MFFVFSLLLCFVVVMTILVRHCERGNATRGKTTSVIASERNFSRHCETYEVSRGNLNGIVNDLKMRN